MADPVKAADDYWSKLDGEATATKDAAVDRKILVAVDFGTTFSGIAWAQTKKPDIQTTIIQWPDSEGNGMEGITSDKVPTELRYDKGGLPKWGFQLDDSAPRYQWFKLDLDPNQSRGVSALAKQFPSRNALPPGYNVAAQNLVTDYLLALRKHTEYILNNKLPKGVLRSTPVEYVITVPAVWSEKARDQTRKCAEAAGMGGDRKLHMISEPEAAAMYALDAMDPHCLNIGDTFVLCDAGGGTVDLISYTIRSLNPLEVDEAAPGTGSLCGSTYLNRIFQKTLEDKFADDEDWDEEILEEAMKRFDTDTKRLFNGESSAETFTIPVHGLRDNATLGIKKGRLRMTRAEIQAIFEPVISEVLSLVQGQIEASRATPKAVLLVGGFGQSAYLRDRIRAMVGADMEVLQSPNAWTAIVRGALMKGLAEAVPTLATVRVRTRSARKSYGTVCGVPYIDGVHNVVHKYYDSFSGRDLCKGMHWMVSKGTAMTEEEPTLFQFWSIKRVAEGPPKRVDAVLYSFAGAGKEPAHANLDVINIAALRGDFSCIPADKITQRRGEDGVMWYVLDYAIAMTCYSAHTKWELVYNDVKYAAVTAEYL
ncbi:MAG: hypothetical protein M1819_001218 [Sarea resinae]|nr:MAG: hypothetical protein M1819_001218 [Sarea resinae]